MLSPSISPANCHSPSIVCQRSVPLLHSNLFSAEPHVGQVFWVISNFRYDKLNHEYENIWKHDCINWIGKPSAVRQPADFNEKTHLLLLATVSIPAVFECEQGTYPWKAWATDLFRHGERSISSNEESGVKPREEQRRMFGTCAALRFSIIFWDMR